MKRFYSILCAVSAFLVLSGCDDTGGSVSGPGIYTEEFGIVFDKNVISADGKDAAGFKVYFKGEDVTSAAKLYRVTGQVLDEELAAKSFKTTIPGSYSFWASYKTLTSTTVTINATDLAIPAAAEDNTGGNLSFKRRAFFHQHTGAGCKFCPYMVKFLRGAINDEIEDRIVLAGIRNYSGEAGFASISNPSGSWPYLQVDYDASYSYNTDTTAFRNDVKSMTASPAAVGISANPVYSPEEKKIICRVQVKAAEPGEYNVGLWLMQDDYYATQIFNNPAAFDDSYHYHNNCVRVAESKYLGAHVGFPLGYMPKGDVRDWIFMLDVNEKWWTAAYEDVDLSDLHIAAFVTQPYVNKAGQSTYRIVNVIDFPYNAPKSFELLK